jgi:glycerophosphoryl diester phosphodiesterase
LSFIVVLQSEAQVLPLRNAHAHNDYEHKRPFFDALEYGFTSFEADIHLINGELYVYHDFPEIVDKNKTLKALYLDPIQNHIHDNDGKIFKNFENEVFLLVDIKTGARATLKELQRQIKPYSSLILHKDNPKGQIRIIISGNRDFDILLEDKKAIIGLDGRPDDLDKNYNSEKMPMISENYNKIISWKGKGEIPQKEFKVLEDLVQKAHRQGKLVRLWATPENEKVWEVLLKAGVDFLNTDELLRLKSFLINR